jgi:hypothetical protein
MRRDNLERVLDPGLRKAVLGASTSPHPASKSVLSGYQRYLDIQEVDSQLEELQRGDIRCGVIIPSRNKIFRLRSGELPMHTILVGSSGSGKTLLASNIIVEASKLNDTKVWVFDKKGEYLWLAKHFGFKLFPLNLLRRNPIEPPPGMPRGHRIETFPEEFMHSFQLGDVSKGVFVRILEYCWEKYPQCSFYQLREATEDLQPRSYKERTRIDYHQKVISREDMVLTSSLRDVVSCYNSMPIDRLLNENIIWSCTGISTIVQNFLISGLLMDAVRWRHYNNVKDPLLLGVIEEAENTVGRGIYLPTMSVSPIENLFRQARSSNVGLVVLNQVYSSLNISVRSDAYTRILLLQTDNHEFVSMAQSMGISGDEMEIARGMRVGDAAVRSGRHPDPFFIRVPEFKVDRNLDYQEVLEQSLPFIQSLPFTPVEEEYKEKIKQMILSGNSTFKTMVQLKEQANDLESSRIDEFLLSIVQLPKLNLNERADKLTFGKSKETLEKTKARMVELGLVRRVEVKRRLRGAPGMYLEITREGKARLIDKGLVSSDATFSEGKGGLIHSTYQTLIKEFVGSNGDGFYAVIEANENRGYSCDVGVYRKENNEKLCAYEVSVMSFLDKEAENATRNIGQGWPEVVLVCVGTVIRDAVLKEDEEATSKKVELAEKRFRQKLDPAVLKRVRITTIKEFLR